MNTKLNRLALVVLLPVAFGVVGCVQSQVAGTGVTAGKSAAAIDNPVELVNRLSSRLGRDGVLPRKFFSYVSKKHQIPSYNLLLIAVVSVGLAFLLNFQTAAEVLVYGGFLGFFAVNLAVVFEYLIRNRQGSIGPLEIWRYLIMPVAGMIIIGGIFINLNPSVIGWVSLWMLFGLTYYGIITKGFRKTIEMTIEE